MSSNFKVVRRQADMFPPQAPGGTRLDQFALTQFDAPTGLTDTRIGWGSPWRCHRTGLPNKGSDAITNSADGAIIRPGFLAGPDEIPPACTWPSVRMIPAHQRLGGIQSGPWRGTEFRLVKHLQLLLFDGFAQLIFQLQALQRAGLQAVGVELEIVATQMLGDACMAMFDWLTNAEISRALSGNRLMPMDALTTSSWPSTVTGKRSLLDKRVATRARLERLP